MDKPTVGSEFDVLDPRDREALRGMLKGLLPLLEPLGSEGLRGAAANCLTILEQPGPVRKLDVAPFIRAVHEHCAELFRRGALASDGDERQQLADLADQADDRVEWFRSRESRARKTLH